MALLEPAEITAFGGILATLVSLAVAMRQTREARKLAKLNGE